jgi:hypothetical protein
MSNKHGMNWISKPSRLAIYLRDGMACAYCGATLEDGAQLTLDHITTREDGGSNKPANLITACHRCNSNRGNRDFTEFVQAVAAYLNHGITGDMIIFHVTHCLTRDLKPFRQMAKKIISQRPSWSEAMKAASK